MEHIKPRLTIKFEKTCKYLAVLVIVFLTNNNLFAQETLRSDPSQLLTCYYSLNALVAGNEKIAALKAQELVNSINGVNYTIISEGNIKILVKDAGRIASTPELKKQRLYFENLSANMVEVAKNVRPGALPVYVLYCPMKKTSG